ncbi:APC amino acid permease [Gonapodya prolifera JEL478]|uniref:APC amino acid permease n=1 Tax=Gonapodya prolifera (strain JEL478) TaxID=1344416 RepID=A0A139AL56_GONPJ|nr:APC amino acid permease [Gonapodya prolifera JEL478]|eukprot:KXS17233.1 APC amino acid permease [Gonapodya prolifera JEL478]
MAIEVHNVITEDELRLARMGYRQEFQRTFKMIHNFGISLSHISILAGVGSLFTYSLLCGGPAGAVWGWVVISLLSLCVALTMAEICSAYPTAGGLYYWSSKLGGEKNGPVFAWFTGWFNLCGEIGGLASTGLGASSCVFSIILVNNPDFDVTLWKMTILAIVFLIIYAVVNTIGGALLQRLMELSIVVHIAGPITIIATLLAKTPSVQSASFVFGNLQNATGQDNQVFAVLLGLLMPSWTFLGYDASAHVAEETFDAYNNAALGIVYSVSASAVVGFGFLVGMLFSIVDIEAIQGSTYPQSLMQLFYDSTNQNVGLSSFLMFIIALGLFLCGVAVNCANSRMMYAFSRDKAFGSALSKFLYWTNPSTRLPVRTIWFGCFTASLITCIGFGSIVGLQGAASIATIGLMTAYILPTLCKLTFARHTFKRGEFNLGSLSEPIGWIAVGWGCFLFVLFCLPSSYPVNASNFNYASVMIVGITLLTSLAWIFSAKKWFNGPIPRVSEDEIVMMEESIAAAKAAQVIGAVGSMPETAWR